MEIYMQFSKEIYIKFGVEIIKDSKKSRWLLIHTKDKF